MLALYDVRPDPVFVAVGAAVPALAGVFLSLAIISLGHWAWRRLRARPGDPVPRDARVPRVFKVLVGIGGVALWLFLIGVLTSRPDRTGYESTAIGVLRAINSGQASYSSSCAAGGYAVDLADLMKVPEGSSQGFVGLNPKDYVNGILYGKWVLTLARDAAPGVTDVSSAASTCNHSAHQPASSYFVSASPVKAEPGRRYFASDARGTIFFLTTGPVPNPIPPHTPVVQ